jgi:hypothetical protein
MPDRVDRGTRPDPRESDAPAVVRVYASAALHVLARHQWVQRADTAALSQIDTVRHAKLTNWDAGLGEELEPVDPGPGWATLCEEPSPYPLGCLVDAPAFVLRALLADPDSATRLVYAWMHRRSLRRRRG